MSVFWSLGLRSDSTPVIRRVVTIVGWWLTWFEWNENYFEIFFYRSLNFCVWNFHIHRNSSYDRKRFQNRSHSIQITSVINQQWWRHDERRSQAQALNPTATGTYQVSNRLTKRWTNCHVNCHVPHLPKPLHWTYIIATLWRHCSSVFHSSFAFVLCRTYISGTQFFSPPK